MTDAAPDTAPDAAPATAVGPWAVPDAPSGSVSSEWRPPDLLPGAPSDGWLVPVRRPRDEADAAAASRVAARRRARPLRLPVPLRPLRSTDVLDGSYAVLKARPATVALLAAIVVVPVQIVNTTVQGDVAAAVSPIVGPLWGEDGESDLVASTVAWATWSLGLLLLGAALSRLMSAWYSGGDLGAREVLREVRGRLPALLVAWLVALAAKTASLVSFGLATPFVAALFVMIAPVIMFERVGATAAIRRSTSLARGRLLFVVVTSIGVVIAEAVLQVLLTGLPWMLASELLPEWLAIWVVAAAAVAARIVTASAAAAAPALFYLDARVRAEGLDLQLAAAEALPPSPGGDPAAAGPTTRPDLFGAAP